MLLSSSLNNMTTYSNQWHHYHTTKARRITRMRFDHHNNYDSSNTVPWRINNRQFVALKRNFAISIMMIAVIITRPRSVPIFITTNKIWYSHVQSHYQLLHWNAGNSLFLYSHLPQTYNKNEDEEPCLSQMFKMRTSQKESCTPCHTWYETPPEEYKILMRKGFH